MKKLFDGRKARPKLKEFEMEVEFQYVTTRQVRVKTKDISEARTMAYNIPTDWDYGDLDYVDSNIWFCHEVNNNGSNR